MKRSITNSGGIRGRKSENANRRKRGERERERE